MWEPTRGNRDCQLQKDHPEEMNNERDSHDISLFKCSKKETQLNRVLLMSYSQVMVYTFENEEGKVMSTQLILLLRNNI